MTNSLPSIKLGELLIYAEILNIEDLNQAIESSKNTKLPVGRELVMRGILSETVLTGAVKLQSLIKDKLVDSDMAIKTLKIVHFENVEIDEALKKAGFEALKTRATALLGEILVEAQITTPDKLNEALATSKETGLPLGRVMVLTQKLSEELLTAALTTQVLIRDEKLTRDQAIQGLKAAKRRRGDFEKSLIEQGLYQPPGKPWIKLGELLVKASLVTETDIMTCLETSLAKELALGEVLVQSGYINTQVLNAALDIQKMVGNKTLSPHFASICLNQIATRGISVEQATAEIGFNESDDSKNIKLTDVLKVCGIASDDDLLKAVKKAIQNSKLLGQILLNAGTLDTGLLNSCLRCQYLINQGFINIEHAVIVMNMCRQKNISFDEALKELGWVK